MNPLKAHTLDAHVFGVILAYFCPWWFYFALGFNFLFFMIKPELNYGLNLS